MVRRISLALLVLSAVAVPLIAGRTTDEARASGTLTRSAFTSTYGTREYWLYVPSGYRGQRVPLVVMLLGCTQTAEDFAAGTKMNALAERDVFLVVYPEQPSSANGSKCWNWFEPAHQQRDRGEPSLIAGIVRAVMNAHNVDANRVHVAGLSAGGAMTAIMGATYPDLFASIGVGAGLEYKAAEDLASGLVAMEAGGPDPDRQGVLAYRAGGAAARVVPVIVFHGDLDQTVRAVNGHQVLSQWAQTNDHADDGLDNGSVINTPGAVLPGQVPGGYAYTRSVYHDLKGNALMEKWIVHTMTHKWSGGSPAGSYTDPKGPDASEEFLRFFREHPWNR